ncbi:hypothetical protein JI435_435100 [Parastagonospora nodorum SN15]|uniref:Uncharacterized protein n=1 Tax=Phaeosphaeria nodorum (strain SN15 / ATCC MYA-4574 / FGSC 10173) TaxID=321614 RepID=A0A7U2I2R4_PHANO|nr:hypothetical protein JI435_435100 [Parastagonospora nodorum SN15]
MFYLTNPRLCNKIIGFNLKRQVSGDVTGKSSVRDVTFKRNVLGTLAISHSQYMSSHRTHCGPHMYKCPGLRPQYPLIDLSHS